MNSLPRIVFLDIDGVLNVRQSTAVFRPMPQGARAQRHAFRPVHRISNRVIRPGCVACLNNLTERSGALLVVSSSWRLRGDARPALRGFGVTGAFHDDWAIDSDGPNRAAEIGRWWQEHGRPAYVVLDDWPHELKPIMRNVALVDYTVGLQDIDVSLALDILADPIQALAAMEP